MYSREERNRAIHLYLKYDKCIADVIRVLGYPNYRTLKDWYAEYQQQLIDGTENEPCKVKPKFTDKEVSTAVKHYLENGKNYTRTVKTLGYPSRETLRKWVREIAPEERKIIKSRIQYSQEDKIRAVSDFCYREETTSTVAETHNVHRRTLYKWKKELFQEELDMPMDIDLDVVKEKLEDEVIALRKEVSKLRMEKDLLEGAAELIKKDPGISLAGLTNKEKTILIDALRKRYPLKELLNSLRLVKSSYYYQRSIKGIDTKYDRIRDEIILLFNNNYKCYGYRRIHKILRDKGIYISEKVVRRLMREEDLVVKTKRSRKYNSYKGELSPAPDNIIQRDFTADKPNSKWLTDITEFRLPAGKVYLSPIIDCFDGKVVQWSISNQPDAEMTTSMLESAISTLVEGETPVIHSDRGIHYRWPGWINLIEKAGLKRSMSKKGYTPDNAACEGFFGRIKNEMFYNRKWSNVTIEDFIRILDQYLKWYNNDRVKMKLGGKSINDYRRSLGIV
ncbi:IS3 family transposase [Gudongella sp. SC589]|uniref:IS3 family transposase n=1 Tax=Gudongella sp. SC589 TaxID=3385990 RepID=UPI003904DEC6